MRPSSYDDKEEDYVGDHDNCDHDIHSGFEKVNVFLSGEEEKQKVRVRRGKVQQVSFNLKIKKESFTLKIKKEVSLSKSKK